MSSAAARVPAWVPPLDALLREALRSAPLLLFATPPNLEAEVARLSRARELGLPLAPRFEARRPPEGLSTLAAALEAAEGRLPRDEPLADVYARRTRQIAGDVRWALALASPGAPRSGRSRFPRRDDFDDRADELAAGWLAEGDPHAVVEGDVRSDDEADPRSLLRRMREEVGARRLPVRVIVVPGIAPLAAAGDGVVQIAAGRRISVEDVERTVLHEIEGHLLPAREAVRRPIGIFSIGTEHGSDDQEGRAVALERRAGHLGARRRRVLSLRHLAARAVHGGAEFADVVGRLEEAGARGDEAIRLAARAARGGGLGREAVYLPALLRVEAAIARDPEIDRVLSAGRVGVDDAAVLAHWL